MDTIKILGKEYYTVKQASKLLDKSISMIRKDIISGRIEANIYKHKYLIERKYFDNIVRESMVDLSNYMWIKDVAKKYGYTTTAIRYWIKKASMTTIKKNKKLYISKQDIELYSGDIFSNFY